MCKTKQHLAKTIKDLIDSGDFTRTEAADEILAITRQHTRVLRFEKYTGTKIFETVLHLRDEQKVEYDTAKALAGEEWDADAEMFCIDVRLAGNDIVIGHSVLGSVGPEGMVSWDMDDDDCFQVAFSLINKL